MAAAPIVINCGIDGFKAEALNMRKLCTAKVSPPVPSTCQGRRNPTPPTAAESLSAVIDYLSTEPKSTPTDRNGGAQLWRLLGSKDGLRRSATLRVGSVGGGVHYFFKRPVV
jgi:hypothetical protein